MQIFQMTLAIWRRRCYTEHRKEAFNCLKAVTEHMISFMYTTLFFLSLVMLILLIAGFRNRISIYYVLLFCAVLITNFGYMQLSGAENLKMALNANQIVYLGASFSPFFFLMCIVDLCKYEMKKAYQICCIAYGVALFVIISATDVFDLYYKSIHFIQENGTGILVKEYGPLHFTFPLYLFLMMGIGMVLIVRSFINKKDVSYTTSVSLLICMIIVVIVYTVEKAAHLRIDLLPFAYIVAQIGVLILLRRISLYDVTAITADSMVRSTAYGFVLCDSRGRYLGGDIAAKNWFPELSGLKIDEVIKSENTPFLAQIGKWISREDNAEFAYLESGERVIEARHTIIKEQRNKAVHCIYLRDDTEQQKYTKLVEQYNENLERDVNEKTLKLSNIQDDIIISMASIVENRDSNTGGHITRTSDVVKIFVNHLLARKTFEILTPEMAKRIIKAAPLHDFGKIAIPDVILNKPGKFTDAEYEEMKKHAAKGAVIVDRILHNSDDIAFRNIAVNIAHYHHEKWNGGGYPTGISGEKIPFEARIMALADVFDALVSKRVYKDSYGYDQAFTIIAESCGTHFDPDLCREFLACREQLEKLYNTYTD